MGDLKIHHVFTGGAISILSYIIANLTIANYELSSEWLIGINAVLIIIPIIFGINHKRNRHHIRNSTGICAFLGHGTFFTLSLIYFQEEMLKKFLENINQIQ